MVSTLPFNQFSRKYLSLLVNFISPFSYDRNLISFSVHNLKRSMAIQQETKTSSTSIVPPLRPTPSSWSALNNKFPIHNIHNLKLFLDSTSLQILIPPASRLLPDPCQEIKDSNPSHEVRERPARCCLAAGETLA